MAAPVARAARARNGATGGAGGNGGGGAGGTVLLQGTATALSGAAVNVSGGSRTAPRAAADDSCSARTPAILSGTVTGSREHLAAAGSQAANPFVGTNPLTPYIPNLPTIGAEIYGLTSLTAAGLVGSLPATDINGVPLTSAVGALFDTSASVLGPAFAGYDALLYINLGANSVANPQMAINEALQSLLSQGFAQNPAFGGSGPTTVTSLAGGAVYGTLVPTGSSTSSAIQLVLPGGTFSATGAALGTGQALYVVPEPSTVAMALMGAFGLLLSALRRRRSK